MRNIDIWQSYREDVNNETYQDKNGKTQLIIKSDTSNPDRPSLTAWIGKAKNPQHNYYFRSMERFNIYKQELIEQVIDNANKKIDRKEQEKKVKKEYQIKTKVGDIFHDSFGYNMILNEFWQVTAIKGKKVELTKLGMEYNQTGYLQYRVKPSINGFALDREGNTSVINKVLQVEVRYNLENPHEYIRGSFGRMYNVTKEVLNGETWLQDELD